MTTHQVSFDVKNYPGATFAQAITWRCTCGKSGTVHDGKMPATVNRARAAFRRHKVAA